MIDFWGRGWYNGSDTVLVHRKMEEQIMEETMEREGYVSLWVGCAASDEELYRYVSLDYEADEDEEIMSQFLKDFCISLDDFDEDYIESVCFDKPKESIADLLTGFSYDKSVIPSIQAIAGNTLAEPCNAVILLYNFHYDGNTDIIRTKDGFFRFVTAAEYTAVLN